MGMCPDDRSCITQDGYETCCLNEHIVRLDETSDLTTTAGTHALQLSIRFEL